MKLLLDPYGFKPPVPISFLRKVGERTLKTVQRGGFFGDCEVSLKFTGETEMTRLNRRYRGKNRSTDVLSFPLLEGVTCPVPKGVPMPLGDVVICSAVARRQALERGVALKQEVALLWVHGLLHLLGYDHVESKQEKKMFALQRDVLSRFFELGE